MGCEVIVAVLKEIFAIGIPDEIIIPVATKLCSLALDETVCHGMAKNLLVRLMYNFLEFKYSYHNLKEF